MKKGVFSGLPADEYHAFPAANNSGLGEIDRSPLHYWANYLDPNREPRRETPAMRLGTAIHCATLEPEHFEARYVAMPDDLDRRTKEGKATYSALEATGKKIISPSELATCQQIARNFRSNPAASVLFDSGDTEQSLFWVDAETGVQCKARPDRLTRDYEFIIDVKSSEDARPEAFARACVTYGYYRAAAWYMDAVEWTTGSRPSAFIFAVFEKVTPFACTFYSADAEMIARGRQENKRLLALYADCLKLNRWPGYPDEIRPIALPRWFARADEKKPLEVY